MLPVSERERRNFWSIFFIREREAASIVARAPRLSVRNEIYFCTLPTVRTLTSEWGGIRNDGCLDHLSLASFAPRRIDRTKRRFESFFFALAKFRHFSAWCLNIIQLWLRGLYFILDDFSTFSNERTRACERLKNPSHNFEALRQNTTSLSYIYFLHAQFIFFLFLRYVARPRGECALIMVLASIRGMAGMPCRARGARANDRRRWRLACCFSRFGILKRGSSAIITRVLGIRRISILSSVRAFEPFHFVREKYTYLTSLHHAITLIIVFLSGTHLKQKKSIE